MSPQSWPQSWTAARWRGGGPGHHGRPGGRARKQHRRAAELADHGSLQQGRPIGLRRAGGRGGYKEHPGRRGPERLHRLGQQRHAGHGGRQLPVVDQRSLDIAARITPLEVDTNVANALLGAVTAAALASELQRRLHLGAAGLQGGRQRPDSVRPAVGRGHFLGGGLQMPCSPPRPLSQRSLLAGTPASRRSRGPRPTRRCWPHTPRTPRSQPARPRSRAPSTQSSRSSPPCSFPAAELLTRRPGRASQLGSSFAEATSFAAALANGDDTLSITADCYSTAGTDAAITAALLAYYTSSQVDTLLGDYRTGTAQDAETTSAITAALLAYYTSSQVDALLGDYRTASAQDTQTQAAIAGALLAYRTGPDQDVFTTNQITSALAAYRSAADQDTATASSIAAALLSYYTITQGLLANSALQIAVRFPDDGGAAGVSVDGYTLTLAANPWNIVRTYNLTPGRELLFACRYRLGTASNFVVYMSEADNVYDPLYGSFVGDQGAWSTAKMYFTVPPNGVAKLHFGAHFQAPGLPNQTAGTVDVYGVQILDATLETGNTEEGHGGFGTAAEARVPRRRGRRRHAGHPGRGAAGAHAHHAKQFSGALQQPELCGLGQFHEGYAMTLSAFAWNIVRTYTLRRGDATPSAAGTGWARPPTW